MKLFSFAIAAITIVMGVPVVASAPAPERSQSIPIAEILVTKASESNVKRGDLVEAGKTIRTNGPRVLNGRLSFGGQVEGTLWAWGVRQITLNKGSTLSIKSYALCAGGGRILELNVKGEAYIQTRYLTQSCSGIKVCLGVGKGCVSLRSSAKVRGLKADDYVVGITEGKGMAQDIDQKLPPVPILAGQYSIMSPDGSFFPAQTVGKTKGYWVATQTKAVQHLEALDGFQIEVKGELLDSVVLPVGVSFKVRSPLD